MVLIGTLSTDGRTATHLAAYYDRFAWFPQQKEASALAAVALLPGLGQGLGFFPADRALASISLPVILILLSIGSLRAQLPGHMGWRCLSLGVLAGSSTKLLSATAGPIAGNMLSHHTGLELSYGGFLRIGWKVGASFCVGGILYV